MRLQHQAGLQGWDEDRAKHLASLMSKASWHYIFTPVCLGAKNQGVPQTKKTATLHALRLICDSWQMVNVLTKAAINMCSDLGAESSLPSVPDFNANRLFAHWDETKLVDDNGLQGFQDEALMGAPTTGVVSYKHALGTPGSEHVCHGIEQQVTSKLKGFKVWFLAAGRVGKFLNGKFYCERLAATCFHRPECA